MRNRAINIPVLILVILVIGISIWINLFPQRVPNQQNQIREIWLGLDVTTRLGLDLQGGTQVLLQAQRADVTDAEMESAVGVIEQRVNGLGVGEAVVQRSGSNRIIVELPGVTDPEQAVETLRGTGQLEFVDSQGQDLTGQLIRTSENPEPVLPELTTTSESGPTASSAITATAGLEATAATTATAALEATQTTTETAALEQTQTTTETVEIQPTVDPGSLINPTIFQTIARGADLDRGSVQPTTQQDLSGARPAVAFAFRGQSQTSLTQFTINNVGQPMCIVLDNVVLSCPFIEQALQDGSGVITVSSQEEADRIYNQLKFGALPVPLNVETSRTVSATLGADSVQASLVAGLIGIGVVMLFMLFYYRLPGLLASLALLAYTLIVFAIYRSIPVVLTLAGIAGFILSIGLAVDANVLIFARLKEELRRGRNLNQAIDLGFDEAWSAIRDSNVATLITCLVLYIFGNSFGVSIVKGFALTLAIGVLISMFSAITITRLLMKLILPLPAFQNLWLYGLTSADTERHRTRDASV